MFKCDNCNKEFVINDFFKEYQEIKNNDNNTKDKVYCPSCNKIQ